MKYKVELIVEADYKEDVYKTFNDLGLEVENVFLYNNTRTLAQNRALWKYAEIMSDELNDRGLNIQKVIKIDMPWTKDRFVDLIWRPVQKALFNTSSTRKLKKHEVDKVHEYIANSISELTNGDLYIPFPSIDTK